MLHVVCLYLHVNKSWKKTVFLIMSIFTVYLLHPTQVFFVVRMMKFRRILKRVWLFMKSLGIFVSEWYPITELIAYIYYISTIYLQIPQQGQKTETSFTIKLSVFCLSCFPTTLSVCRMALNLLIHYLILSFHDLI